MEKYGVRRKVSKYRHDNFNTQNWIYRCTIFYLFSNQNSVLYIPFFINVKAFYNYLTHQMKFGYNTAIPLN